MNEGWQERVPPEDEESNYRPTVSRSIKSPSAGTVDDVSGMMYVTLNGVQRLVHDLVRASDGLVSEENAKGEVTKLELWIQKAAATMQKQQHAITELRLMLDIYEKNVWDKTQEFASMQAEMAKNDSLAYEEQMENKDKTIASLQQQVTELENHYNSMGGGMKFLEDRNTQTDNVEFKAPVEEQPHQTVLISANRKIKSNMKHPIFLKLKCNECKMSMTRSRWEALPRTTRKRLAEIQQEVDIHLIEKQQAILSLLPKSCVACKDMDQIQSIAQPFKVKDTLQEQRMTNLMDILMADPEPDSPKKEEPQQEPESPAVVQDDDAKSNSSHGSQKSSIYFTQAKSNILRRGISSGISKLRRRTGNSAGDHSSMTPPQMASLAILNRWRDSQKAWDVPLQRTNPKQKIGLRLEKKKGLQVMGFDPDTPAAALQDIIPVGSFLVAVDYNPVSKFDSMFKQLMSNQEITLTFGHSCISADPQKDLEALLREEAQLGMANAAMQPEERPEPTHDSYTPPISTPVEAKAPSPSASPAVDIPPMEPAYTQPAMEEVVQQQQRKTPVSCGVAESPPPCYTPPLAVGSQAATMPQQPVQSKAQPKKAKKGLFESSSDEEEGPSRQHEDPLQEYDDPLAGSRQADQEEQEERCIPDNLSDRADEDKQLFDVSTQGSRRGSMVSSLKGTPALTRPESIRDDASLFSAFTAADEGTSGSVPKQGWFNRLKKKPKPKQTPTQLQEDAFPTF